MSDIPPAHYVLERELGRGGMATVYLARDLRHDRPVALKVLRPEIAAEIGTGRFLREIKLAAGLHHPHILPVYDSGMLEPGDTPGAVQRPFYVMPYVEGESLRARLLAGQPLALDEVVRIGMEVADALDHAHRRDIVHRDIKPENILLEDGHALVADFGVARAITAAGQEGLTAAGFIVGTPVYMSPEQVVGETELDGRSDIYSLGCVLFEMLAGAPPFTGSTTKSLMIRRVLEPAPALRAVRDGIPEAVELTISRALERSPGDRFQTAAALAQALGRPGQSVTPIAPVPLSERHAIAVLPFVNLSPERENEYFSDGMTEEIINALTRVKGLRVVARTSCFAFKGTELDAQTIAARLKVSSLVEGSVRKVGNRIRLTAQLVDAADGYQRWSQTFERTMGDVFVLQEELARSIVSALPVASTGSVERALVKPITSNLEAYSRYMRGRYFVNKRTIDDLRLAAEYFEQAIELDPAMGPAHSGVAACLSLRGFDEFGDLPPHETMPKAKAAALKAMELDPEATEPHIWLGVIAMLYEWDRQAAEAHLRIATESSANPIAHTWYAIFLTIMGRYEESIARILHAQALDPISLPVHQTVARCYAWAGRYDAAIEQLQATLQMEPRHPLTYLWIGRAFFGKSRFQEALAEAQKGMAIAGRLPNLVSLAGCALAKLGRHAEARELLEEVRRLSARQYVSPVFQANILGAMGELDEAFRFYDLAVEHRVGLMAFVRAEFRLETFPTAVRADPRFTTLRDRVWPDW